MGNLLKTVPADVIIGIQEQTNQIHVGSSQKVINWRERCFWVAYLKHSKLELNTNLQDSDWMQVDLDFKEGFHWENSKISQKALI